MSVSTIKAIACKKLESVKKGRKEFSIDLLDFGTSCTSLVTMTLFFGGGSLNV